MCGIFGTFGVRDSAAEVEAGLDRIIHRGPDGRGSIGLDESRHGHVRLSLLDPSPASSQPFRLGETTLSWTGEIWNWRELRSELSKRGRKFQTTGDTEVLAAVLEDLGEEGLRKLDGMFSLAWTNRRGTFLARDRMGKIPLYLLRSRDGWRWSSERAGFAGRTGGFAKPVPPGAIVDLRTRETREFSALPRGETETADPAEIIEILRRAVRRRMTADALVCCLISGGLDSSLVLALALEVRRDVVAWTAVHDERSEDAIEARRFCRELGVELREVRVPTPTFESVAEACLAIEIPSKAQTEIALPCLELAREMSAAGFKACLSGEGADEIFGGYGNSIIAASREGDSWWRRHRRFLTRKMSRGNFVRCNKAFMRRGVECRLPFCDDTLVDLVLPLGKKGCPPGKGLLKTAAKGLVPDRIIRRIKQTFQGGSGISREIAAIVHDPIRLYNCEIRKRFGKLVKS